MTNYIDLEFSSKSFLSAIESCNDKVKPYNEDKNLAIASVAITAFGLLSLALKFAAPVAFASVSIMLSSFFIAFGIYTIYQRVQAAKELRQEMTGLMEHPRQTLYATKFIDDPNLTENDVTQMLSIFPQRHDSYHQLKLKIFEQKTVELRPGYCSYFSASPIGVDGQSITNNLETVQKKFRPWRNLLKELTAPDSIIKASNAEKRVVHALCDDVTLTDTIHQGDGKTYHIDRDRCIRVFGGNTWTTAFEFRAFLQQRTNND